MSLSFGVITCILEAADSSLAVGVNASGQGIDSLDAYCAAEKLPVASVEIPSDVVLVEDVTTSGGSVLKAIKEVQGRGCRVHAVIAIVDRNDGVKERLAAEGIALIALFDTTDFSAKDRQV